MPTSPAQLILTITPDGQMLVSARTADGTQTPPRAIAIDQDNRLGAFVADMQALARRQLATIESPTIGRTGDGDPAIAVEAAHGEDVRQRCHAVAT